MVRYKNRYFAVEIEPRTGAAHAPFNVQKTTIYKILINKIQQMHGDFGVGCVRNGFTTKYINPYTKIALIRVRHGPHRLIASILPLVREIDQVKVRLNVLYVGATMVKCFKFIRNYQQRKLEELWNRMKSREDQLKLKEALLNINEMTTRS